MLHSPIYDAVYAALADLRKKGETPCRIDFSPAVYTLARIEPRCGFSDEEFTAGGTYLEVPYTLVGENRAGSFMVEVRTAEEIERQRAKLAEDLAARKRAVPVGDRTTNLLAAIMSAADEYVYFEDRDDVNKWEEEFSVARVIESDAHLYVVSITAIKEGSEG